MSGPVGSQGLGVGPDASPHGGDFPVEGKNSVGSFALRLVCHDFSPVFCRFARREDAFRVAQNEKAFHELDGDVIPYLDVRKLNVESLRLGFQ